MSMRINKAGEEEFSADIHDLGVAEFQIFARHKDLLAFYQ